MWAMGKTCDMLAAGPPLKSREVMWQMHYIIRVKFNQSHADEVFKIYERVAILVFIF